MKSISLNNPWLENVFQSASFSCITTSKAGAELKHYFLGCGYDRYCFDFNLGKDWQQFDTKEDASYFGVWVNLKEFMTLTYAEGDLTLLYVLIKTL